LFSKNNLSTSDLKVIANNCGLKLVGVLDLSDAQSALKKNANILSKWQGQGFAGEMKYMLRPKSLFSDIRNVLPDTRSIVCFVVSYYQGEFPEAPSGYGRVARYAWGRDYHIILRDRLSRFVQVVREHESVSQAIRLEVFY
jgi:epoxyqueuosine reductase